MEIYFALFVVAGIIIAGVLADVYSAGKAKVRKEVLEENSKVDKLHKELSNAQLKKALDGATTRADAVKRMQQGK